MEKQFYTMLIPLSVMLLFASFAAAGTVTYQYDNLNRIVRMEKSGDYVIEYAYDTSGNRTETITQVQGPVIDHDLDGDVDGEDLQIFATNFSGSAQDLFDFSQLFGTKN